MLLSFATLAVLAFCIGVGVIGAALLWRAAGGSSAGCCWRRR